MENSHFAPENHLLEKENRPNQIFIFGFQPLIFRGVQQIRRKHVKMVCIVFDYVTFVLKKNIQTILRCFGVCFGCMEFDFNDWQSIGHDRQNPKLLIMDPLGFQIS